MERSGNYNYDTGTYDIPSYPDVDPDSMRFAAAAELLRRDADRANVEARNKLSTFAYNAGRILVADQDYKPCSFTKVLCHGLQRVVELADIHRKAYYVLVSVPAQHGKTFHVSKCLPAWYMGKFNNRNTLIINHVKEYADKLSREILRIIESKVYREIFPSVTVETRLVGDFSLSNGCTMKGFGIDGSISGHSGHLILVDDPIKGAQELKNPQRRDDIFRVIRANVLTREQVNTVFVMVHTRWAFDDPIGRFRRIIDQANEQAVRDGLSPVYDDGQVLEFKFRMLSDKYEYYNPDTARIVHLDAPFDPDDPEGEGFIPFRTPGDILHPSLHGLDNYRRMRAQFYGDNDGPGFEAMYNQEPIADTGTVFDPALFKRFQRGQEPKLEDTHVIMSWDFALSDRETADFNACTVWAMDARGHLYLVGLRRFRGVDGIEPNMIGMIRYFRKKGAMFTVLHEEHNIFKAIRANITRAIAMEFPGETIRMVGIPPKASKLTRSFTAGTFLRTGKLHVPEEDVHMCNISDVTVFINQMALFTGDKNNKDDYVDTVSDVCNAVEKGRIEKPRPDKFAYLDDHMRESADESIPKWLLEAGKSSKKNAAYLTW